ncbi:MAG: SHOCT domain-containing protein [Microthrixaceae bacterium]|nr:SHOCT domain-containing protein [Microthrixaceae bacterium]
MLFAEIGDGTVLWSLLTIFFMVIYFMILFSIFGDLFRSKDLSGLAKALWVLAIFVFFFIAPFVYLIVRGSGMGERAMEAQADAQRQVQDYAQQVVTQTGGGAAADQIAKAKDLLDSGTITQAEFDALKAKALG